MSTPVTTTLSKLPDTVKPTGPLQVAIAILTTIITAVGGVVTAVAPHSLSVNAYLNDLQGIAFAVAGLGLGKGIHLGLSNLANRAQPLTVLGEAKTIASDVEHGEYQAAVGEVGKELPVVLAAAEDPAQVPDPQAVDALATAAAVDEPSPELQTSNLPPTRVQEATPPSDAETPTPTPEEAVPAPGDAVATEPPPAPEAQPGVAVAEPTPTPPAVQPVDAAKLAEAEAILAQAVAAGQVVRATQ